MSASGWAGGRATDKQPSHSVKGMAENGWGKMAENSFGSGAVVFGHWWGE